MSQQQPTASPAILARLKSLGDFTYHRPSWLGRWIGVPAEIEWDSPAGFEGELAPVSAALWFECRRHSTDSGLCALLDAIDDFRAQWAGKSAEIREFVVECFRRHYESELPAETAKRLANADGKIEAESVLRDVRSIHLRFDATGKSIVRTAWISAGWDREEGISVEWDLAGQILRPWQMFDAEGR